MTGCEHAGGERARVCRHLLGNDVDHVVRFSGRGTEHDFVCSACVETHDLRDVCSACRAAATRDWTGIVGAPEIAVEPSSLWFEHRALARAVADAEIVDAQPVIAGERNLWIALCADGGLRELDLDRVDADGRPAARHVAVVPPTEFDAIRVSRDGRFVAVFARRGLDGIVIDLANSPQTVALRRDDNCEPTHSDFSIAFIERAGRQLVVYAPGWNRLDVIDAATAELLTRREPDAVRGDARTLDYFHCSLVVSPTGRHIADNGWVWHPGGMVTTWSLDRWLDTDPWESETGASRRELCWRDYFWDGPMCWLDDDHLAVWGFGRNEEWLLPAVRIFDARSGAEVRWFPGPRGELVFDRVLVALDRERWTVWNTDRGTRLLDVPCPGPGRSTYHPGAKVFVTFADAPIVSRLCGHDAEWSRGAIAELAGAIASDRDHADALPVLGDALEAAGYSDVAVLAHCRQPGAHGDHCWVLDRLRPRP